MAHSLESQAHLVGVCRCERCVSWLRQQRGNDLISENISMGNEGEDVSEFTFTVVRKHGVFTVRDSASKNALIVQFPFEIARALELLYGPLFD